MKKVILSLLAIAACVSLSAQSLVDAQRAIEAEKFEDARVILERLVAANPKNAEYNFYLGNLYLTLQEDALARENFEKGVANEKTGKMNNIGLGRMALDAGNIELAEEYFAKALYKIKKKDTKELMYLAEAYAGSRNPNYAKAKEYASQAIAKNPKLAPAYLILGDAEFNLGNPSAAYSAYRNAYVLDNTLLRGQLQIANITKSAAAFVEAVEAINEILEAHPNYGPAYRELAEIHYLWSLNTTQEESQQHLKTALDYYNQYMDKTDYSLNSRMRRADFLILAKDYEALEKEAMEMQKIDNVNPRIYRYLGISAYENENYKEAADAIYNFMSKVEPIRIIGIDYLYLAKAEAKLAIADNGKQINEEHFDKMENALGKAIEMDAAIGDDFYETGVSLFRARNYPRAAELFGILITNPKSSLMDNLYFANSIFYNAASMSEEEQVGYQTELLKADSVYGAITEASPTTQDLYFNRARLNRYIVGDDKDERVKNYFEDYIRVLTEKGEEEMNKEANKRKLSEAYTDLGIYNIDRDRDRCIECFELAVALDPTNDHAARSLDFLRKNKK